MEWYSSSDRQLFLRPTWLCLISSTYLVNGETFSLPLFSLKRRDTCFLHFPSINVRLLVCQLCLRLHFLPQREHCVYYNDQLYFSVNNVLELVWNIAFNSVFIPIRIQCRSVLNCVTRKEWCAFSSIQNWQHLIYCFIAFSLLHSIFIKPCRVDRQTAMPNRLL